MRRMRRLRKPGIRDLVAETDLGIADLIQPIFVDQRISEPRRIDAMPGQFRQSLESLAAEAGALEELGVPAVLLFGLPSQKDELGSGAYDPDGVIQKAVRIVKETTDLVVITDLCLCEYTSHGHCGLIRGETVLNDETLPLLGEAAVSHAEAGADIVAPSGMMDHMVQTIRAALDMDGYTDMPILSYAAKYASAFYGPFREAAESGFAFGDPQRIPDESCQLRRSPLGGAAGHRGRRRYGHGQAGYALPGYSSGCEGYVWHAHSSLSGLWRVLYDHGRSRAGLAG